MRSGTADIPGPLSGASGFRFAIVYSRFNDAITESLRDGARRALDEAGARADDVEVVSVPGAFELPQAARSLAETGTFDAVVCLGCVIRGATPHFDYVAGEASRGIGQVSTSEEIPIGFGILTVDTIEQAIERAGTKAGNKGADAALAAIQMATVLRQLEQ